MTEQNLLRGKEIFQERCVGCHGVEGDGKGPGAKFLSPAPADFTDKDDACCGGDTGPGDFYYRILRGWPGTAMENFGDRLSVNDIWRVVLFVKTIPNKTLRKNYVPQPSRLHHVAALEGAPRLGEEPPEARGQRRVHQAQVDRSVHAGGDAGHARASRPGDSFLINDGKTRLSLKDAAAGIKTIYEDLLEPSLGRSPGTRDKLPVGVAEGDPADRAGAAMRRRLVILALLVLRRARAARRRPRPRPARNRPVALGDGRLDDGHVLRLLRARARRVRRRLEDGRVPRARHARVDPAVRQEEDYYTPDWALDEEEWR